MNPLNHVAIIMDGNGRWGLKHKNSRNEGHRAGLKTIEKILKETIKQKIKFDNHPTYNFNVFFTLLFGVIYVCYKFNAIHTYHKIK